MDLWKNLHLSSTPNRLPLVVWDDCKVCQCDTDVLNAESRTRPETFKSLLLSSSTVALPQISPRRSYIETRCVLLLVGRIWSGRGEVQKHPSSQDAIYSLQPELRSHFKLPVCHAMFSAFSARCFQLCQWLAPFDSGIYHHPRENIGFGCLLLCQDISRYVISTSGLCRLW